MNTVTYDDLHIDFTWKEWALLNPSQKNLYKDVMLETYRNLATIGSLLGLKVLVNQLLKWRNYFGLRIILNGGGLSSWKQTRGIPQQLPVACKM
ncbi:zinc finger protein 177-like isoform X8 [Arvicola amphibius]|uniref:zinc finger protein 177-like isoform X8 n=1 Tax=Arvicola amphibius TaxID=1047088 RepID=UPI001C08CBB8|nr:zinc finger protein 177-like isoform X8 [Arvicola amphibius]